MEKKKKKNVDKTELLIALVPLSYYLLLLGDIYRVSGISRASLSVCANKKPFDQNN